MRLLICLMLFLPNVAMAKSQVYSAMPDKDFPSEIHLILQSLPLETLNPDYKNKLDGFVKNFSAYSAQLSTKDIYFIVKSETAKAILAARPSHTPQYQIYNLKKLEEIEGAIDWNGFRPWSKYVYQALLQDARELIGDARYPSLWRPIENPTAQSEQAVLRRRVELILSWIDYLAYTTHALVNEKMEIIAFNALERIERASWLLSTLNAVPIDSTAAPLAFEIKELVETPQKTAAEILDKVVDPVVQNELPVLPNPVNDWLPREIPNTPQGGKNIIKQKDLFYTPPAELPKPTNDWILSL